MVSELQGFEEFVSERMEEWKVQGLGIAIVKDGEVIFCQGFGLRDVAKGLPVTPETIFAIGSSSKAFTTMSMGILVDEGKLDWDRPVREYLPTFKLYDHFATERMTPRDLVTHRSGLPRHDLVWYNSSATREELFHRLQYLEPSKDFRSYFQYQNLMYMTAGYLVGQLTGGTWEQVVRERIFQPLGMTSANFDVSESQRAADFSKPYSEKEGIVEEIPFRNITTIGPAGSINASVKDMAKWVQLHLGKGEFNGQRIISEANLKEMHTPQMVILHMPGMSELTQYTELGPMSYGLGWFIQHYRGHQLVHHGGNIDGFSAMVAMLPNDNIGVVVLTNMNGTPLGEILAFNVFDRLLGLNEVEWNPRIKELYDKMREMTKQAKEAMARERKPNTQPSHPLADYAGEFENPGYGTLTVTLEGNELKARYNDLPFTVKHYHYDIFEFTLKGPMEQPPMPVSYFTDVKGNIDRLSAPLALEPSLKEIVFTRKADKRMSERSFLEQFTGEYELMGMTLKVALKGEVLVATVPGQGEQELAPYRGTEFKLKNAPAVSIEFKIDDAGKVSEAVVTQPGATLTAKRK